MLISNPEQLRRGRLRARRCLSRILTFDVCTIPRALLLADTAVEKIIPQQSLFPHSTLQHHSCQRRRCTVITTGIPPPPSPLRAPSRKRCDVNSEMTTRTEGKRQRSRTPHPPSPAELFLSSSLFPGSRFSFPCCNRGPAWKNLQQSSERSACLF